MERGQGCSLLCVCVSEWPDAAAPGGPGGSCGHCRHAGQTRRLHICCVTGESTFGFLFLCITAMCVHTGYIKDGLNW